MLAYTVCCWVVTSIRLSMYVYVFVGAGFPMHCDLIWSVLRPYRYSNSRHAHTPGQPASTTYQRTAELTPTSIRFVVLCLCFIVLCTYYCSVLLLLCSVALSSLSVLTFYFIVFTFYCIVYALLYCLRFTVLSCYYCIVLLPCLCLY
jgi:hypothetical protein